MLSCCRHCKYTGSFFHEIGWACKKHDFFIHMDDLESLERASHCKDCQLDLDELFRKGVKADVVSIGYVLEGNSGVHNGIHTYTRADDPTDKLYVKGTSADMVVGYVVFFDGFPVFRTNDESVVRLIKEGFNFKI